MSGVEQNSYTQLNPPGRVYACRAPQPTAKDSAAFVLRIVDNADFVSGRQTVAAYDSAGTPLYIAIRAPDTLSANPRLHVIAIRFRPQPRGVWTVIEGDSTGRLTHHARNGQPVHTPPSGADLVTPDEISRAAEFADWAWRHRCGTPK